MNVNRVGFYISILCHASLLTMPAIGASVELAIAGKPALPVVVSSGASERVRKAAATLADYLGRISGGHFEVTTGEGKNGIAVGLLSDFPALKISEPWDKNDITRREDYLLRSTSSGLLVIGSTELAVEDATWDLLYRLGYRQFFPGEHWEVIPKIADLHIEVDTHEHPAYLGRRIWYGFGLWDYNAGPYADWCAKNRMTSGVELSSGHAYQGIIKRNKDAFAAHPEYLGLVDGTRKSSKFCISNPELRKLVVEDALHRLEKKPDSDSISMEPSDGGGWCECDKCAKLGSISDRAVLLANEVAAAIGAHYPGKLVGMYAYNYHSPPPNIPVAPNVIISVATAFIKGSLTLGQILSGWQAHGATLGIREFYSVNAWDRDLPGAARGGNINYLRDTIPKFYAKGARYMSAEASDNWGPNGLGYYLAARMLWDCKESDRTEDLTEDFLDRAFESAKEPMREFYRRLDGSTPHLVISDQLGHMFRALDQARQLADAPDVRARLDDLVLYARYVDLCTRYFHAKNEARQQPFEALIRHAYRMRQTMLVHTKGLYRDLAHRDKTVSIPDGAQWNVPEGQNPWKSSKPFSPDDLSLFVAEGMKRYPLANIDFKPLAFSKELVSVAALKLPDVPPGQLGAARGKQTFYTRVDTAPAKINLTIMGGMIEHYRDRGNVRVELWKVSDPSQIGDKETLSAENRDVPPDGKEHAVSLPTKESGLYKVVVTDGHDRTLVKCDSPLPFTIKSSVDEPMTRQYSELWLLYFYVPKGTKTVGLFGGEHGEVRDSAGRALFWLNGREPNYYSVDVPDGEDGKLWSIQNAKGSIQLLTVPPYFALNAAQLLLPADVVERDRAKN